ncbi:MAG: c-type cytochrome [Gallionella sp.]
MNKYVAELFLLLALVAGCSEKQDHDTLKQLPLDLASGKELAQKSCSTCHGMDGKGVTDSIPNLAAQVEPYLLHAVQTYKHGKREGSSGAIMDIAKQFSPTQLRNVLGYYASLPPVNNLVNTEFSYSYYDLGKKLSEPCSQCHGADGNPKKSGIPHLAGQHPQYIVKATKAYQVGTRTMPAMHKELTSLSLADIENIAIYFGMNQPKRHSSNVTNPYEGKQFTYNCTQCHGSTGTSTDLSIPNLAGQDVAYLYDMIREYRDKVRVHNTMHQLIQDFKDSEIKKIAEYFASEEPVQMSFIPPESISALSQKCDLCHSSASANPNMLAPKLKGQNRTYLINALAVYRDGDRGNTAMHKMSSMLYFDTTMEGIASYYSSQRAE